MKDSYIGYTHSINGKSVATGEVFHKAQRSMDVVLQYLLDVVNLLIIILKESVYIRAKM